MAGTATWPRVGCPPAHSPLPRWRLLLLGVSGGPTVTGRSVCHRAAFHILVPVLGCVRVRTQICPQPEGGSCRVVVGVFSARLPAGTLT